MTETGYLNSVNNAAAFSLYVQATILYLMYVIPPKIFLFV